MLKLLYIFESIVLLGVRTCLSIIALFIVVIICNHGKNFFRAFRPYVVKSYITSNNRTIRSRVSLLIFLLPKPLFGLFPSLFGGLCIAGAIICKFGLLSFFKLYDPRVLHNSVLGLYFNYNNVSKTILLLSLVVYLSNIRSRL